jgi:dedicator of cytokinesis protein 3
MQERVASPHLGHSTVITSIATVAAPSATPTTRSHSRANHSRGLSFLKRNNIEPLKEKPNGNSTAQSRARGLSETSSKRGREKENGRSQFTGSSNRLRSQYAEKDDEAGLVNATPSEENGATGNIANGSLKRVGTDGTTRTAGSESLGSRVGSVRKRLSMLKLGKKPSKSGGLVDAVAEEE